MGAFRQAPIGVCFTGNSLTEFAEDEGHSYGELFIEDTGYCPNIIAVGGYAWVMFANAKRLPWMAPMATSAERMYLLMVGGLLDCSLGTRTPAQIYADMVTIADYARDTLDYSGIVASTITPSTSLSGPTETNRTDTNALIIADASTAFDVVVQLAEEPGLDDATDTDFYMDGTHFTSADGDDLGAQTAATLMAAGVASLL